MESPTVVISPNGETETTKDKNHLFLGNFRACLREYCEVSSIQGLSYLIKDISVFERCWWIIVFLLCVSGCSNMISEVCQKWIATPVLVSLATKDTPIHKIPFPAVTICPETKIAPQCVNYSKVLKMRRNGTGHLVSPTESTYFDYMALLCTAKNLKNKKYSKKSSSLNDYADFLNQCKGVSLSNSLCKFNGVSENCSTTLVPIVTDEGLCYSFNMLGLKQIYSDVNKMKYLSDEDIPADWDVDNGYPNANSLFYYPIRAFGSGAKYSFVFVLLTKKTNICSSCSDFALQGMRVTLHMPATIPRPNQIFFPVGLNELVDAQVIPTYMSTSPKVRVYDPKVRNCYFSSERKLKYFRIYTQSNCDLECWTNYTIQECGCVHFYMPRDANTTICSLAKRECLQRAQETYAVSHFPKHLHQGKLPKGKLDSDCECLPLCTNWNYRAVTSRGIWDWNDPNGANVRDLKKYFKDYHASAVKIYFKSLHYLPIEKNELYGMADFLSNVGGILGLFTGFSLFSLLELIYFLCIRPTMKYKWF